MAGWLPAIVRQATLVTPSGRVLVIDVPDWPGNLPGQHLDLRLTADDGYQAVRSYSIASYGPGTAVELAVDEVPDGEVSPYLVEDVLPGDELEVRGPLGQYFVWRSAQTEPVQLIAGGSGVVPLVAIVRAHRDLHSAVTFRMLYSVRSPSDAYFADELTKAVDAHYALDWVYTRTAPPGRPPPGRVTASILETTTIRSEDRPTVYVCGPTGFVELVASSLVDLGHEPARIRTERFGGA